MEQIGKGDAVASKILLLRENPLISLQRRVEVLEFGLDDVGISGTKASARLENFFPSNFVYIRLKVGKF